MSTFTYAPSLHIPFRDKTVINRVGTITREEIDKHPNPGYRIQVIPDSDVAIYLCTELFYRIKTAMDAGENCVLLMPNPWPMFRNLAAMINKFKVNCSNLYTFNLDEYVDENGNIAPETWEYGFAYSFKQNFYMNIAPELRPPEKHIYSPTNENINDYGKMLSDLGEADLAVTGPGWTGHLAFIDPDSPEYTGITLEEFKERGPGIVTLSPFTIAQNSLHSSFGSSGDLSRVPPKAATIGPAQVVRAKNRLQFHSININGTQTSWQRFMSRLVMHGPVTPLVPESICQTLRTDVLVSETSAKTIKADFEKGY